MNMKANLLFVRNNGILFNYIRWITKCKYDHIATFENPEVLIEATMDGVNRQDGSYYIERRKAGKVEFDIYEIKGITEEQKEKMLDYMRSMIGEKYDFIQVLCVWLFLLLGINKRLEPIDVDNAWFCSELVGEAAYNAGFRFTNEIDPDRLTPKDILESGILQKI